MIFAAGRGVGAGGGPWPFGVQEGLMAVLALGAWASDRAAAPRPRTRFTFGPIVEVAVLFAGIFVTMAPALVMLNAHAREPRRA